MNDFQILNEVVTQAVQQSSYFSVLISSCVFIVYTIIIKVVDYYKAKDKSKPMLEMATSLKEVTNNVVKLNTVLDKVIKDVEQKEERRCKTIIKLAFSSFTDTLSKDAIDMMVHNHIEDNKDIIQENVTKLVSTEYYKVYGILSGYEVNGLSVANRLNKNWIEETTKAILGIMFNGQETTRRITQVNDKLHTYADTYVIYLENKTFNN